MTVYTDYCLEIQVRAKLLLAQKNKEVKQISMSNENQNQAKQNENNQNLKQDKESNQQNDTNNQDQESLRNESSLENQNNGHNDDNVLSNSSNEVQRDGQEDEGKETKSGSAAMNLALVGGVVGAGAGLLAKPEIGKKIVKSLGESELVKVAGKEFKKTAQELLAGQAQESFKHMATGYIDKMSNSFANIGSGKSGNNNSKSDSAKYEEIKQENEELNGRLDRIESMLNKLASSK